MIVTNITEETPHNDNILNIDDNLFKQDGNHDYKGIFSILLDEDNTEEKEIVDDLLNVEEQFIPIASPSYQEQEHEWPSIDVSSPIDVSSSIDIFSSSDPSSSIANKDHSDPMKTTESLRDNVQIIPESNTINKKDTIEIKHNNNDRVNYLAKDKLTLEALSVNYSKASSTTYIHNEALEFEALYSKAVISECAIVEPELSAEPFLDRSTMIQDNTASFTPAQDLDVFVGHLLPASFENSGQQEKPDTHHTFQSNNKLTYENEEIKGDFTLQLEDVEVSITSNNEGALSVSIYSEDTNILRALEQNISSLENDLYSIGYNSYEFSFSQKDNDDSNAYKRKYINDEGESIRETPQDQEYVTHSSYLVDILV